MENIEITGRFIGNFGSKFQRKFAFDTLLIMLKAWESYLKVSHKKNHIKVELDGIDINNLEWLE